MSEGYSGRKMVYSSIQLVSDLNIPTYHQDSLLEAEQRGLMKDVKIIDKQVRIPDGRARNFSFTR